jgi:hypothetical protein
MESELSEDEGCSFVLFEGSVSGINEVESSCLLLEARFSDTDGLSCAGKDDTPEKNRACIIRRKG